MEYFTGFISLVICLVLALFILPLFKKDPTDTPAPTKPTKTGLPPKRIKCNISRKGQKIYHLPGSRLYDAVKVDPDKGEMYVDTEEQAIAKGFRKSEVH